MADVGVVVVDDDVSYINALAELIDSVDGFYVVGTATDVESGLDLLTLTPTQMGLVDVNMPGGGGLAVLEALDQHPSRPKMVLISAQDVPLSDHWLESANVEFVAKDDIGPARLRDLWTDRP